MLQSKRIRLFIVGSVLIFFVVKTIVEISHARCDVLKEFLNNEFNGLVVNKYIDSTSHSTKTIVIKNFDRETPDFFTLLEWDESGFYYKVDKNDTILKERGKNIVHVKNGIRHFADTLYFGCERKR